MATHCAVCGKLLKVLEHGAFAQCHKSLGYWFDEAPLPEDMWAAWEARPGWWLFIRPGFPRKR